MAKDAKKGFFGVYIQCPSPLEIEVLPGIKFPLLDIKSMGGNFMKIQVFAGPTPAKVTEQLTSFTGRPKLLPKWSMGLHLCRSNETNILGGFNYDFTQMNNDNFPYDSDCIDSRVIQGLKLNQLINEDSLNEAVELLHSSGKKFLVQTPLPANPIDFPDGHFVKYSENMTLDLKDEQNNSIPDFLHHDLSWIKTAYQDLKTDLNYDGIHLTDNGPDLITAEKTSKFPEYIPESLRDTFSKLHNGLYQGIHNETPSMVHKFHHNSYPTIQMKVLAPNVDNLFTEFSSEGTSEYGGTIGNQEYEMTWASMRSNLRQNLINGLTGQPFYSSPDCGGNDPLVMVNSTVQELCLHWYQLSSFMPSLNSITFPPWKFTSRTYAQWAKRALLNRYKLMPYLYTLFWQSSQNGWPIVRPLFFDFYWDTRTWSIESQFMVGDCLLIAPKLEEKDIKMDVYFPEGTWYQFNSGKQINGGRNWTIPTQKYLIPSYLKRGSIIPLLVTIYIGPHLEDIVVIL